MIEVRETGRVAKLLASKLREKDKLEIMLRCPGGKDDKCRFAFLRRNNTCRLCVESVCIDLPESKLESVLRKLPYVFLEELANKLFVKEN